jgi:hypothetical protein
MQTYLTLEGNGPGLFVQELALKGDDQLLGYWERKLTNLGSHLVNASRRERYGGVWYFVGRKVDGTIRVSHFFLGKPLLMMQITKQRRDPRIGPKVSNASGAS